MEREYTIVLAAGVVALALAGASRAEVPGSASAIPDKGHIEVQQRFSIGKNHTDKFEPPLGLRSAGEIFPLMTPAHTDRSAPATICACPTPSVLPQTGPLVG